MIKKLVILIVIITNIVIVGCRNNAVISDVPDDFNFSLEYGIITKSSNTIDIYENFLEMDTVEGQVKINFQFKEEDIEKIYKKMSEFQIIEYSSNLSRSSKSSNMELGHGHNGYWKLKVNYRGEEKTFYWTTKSFPLVTPEDFSKAEERGQTIREYMLEENKNDEQLTKLYNLSDIVSYILDIIGEYEEINNLPQKQLYL